MLRRHPFANLDNLRDLGGYATEGGGITRYGVFFRSDAPHSIQPAEVDALRQLGITDVVDLRSEREVDEWPSVLATSVGFTVHRCAFPNDGGIINSDADVPPSYLRFLSESGGVMRRVFGVLATAPGGVLYHCAVGKDRTGVVTALTLLLCGVAEADVVADYQVSYTYLYRVRKYFEGKYPDAPACLMKSDPAYMWAFLEGMRERWGSARGALAACGVPEEELDAIVRRLVQAP